MFRWFVVFRFNLLISLWRKWKWHCLSIFVNSHLPWKKKTNRCSCKEDISVSSSKSNAFNKSKSQRKNYCRISKRSRTCDFPYISFNFNQILSAFIGRPWTLLYASKRGFCHTVPILSFSIIAIIWKFFDNRRACVPAAPGTVTLPFLFRFMIGRLYKKVVSRK